MSVETANIEGEPRESTSLLQLAISETDIEIDKRDTREPYYVVALKEFKWMTSSSFLTALALLLQELIYFIDIVSVGHLGATELAAMMVSVACFNSIALGPVLGLMEAMETFCSNAYAAASDKTMVGFHLQRGIIALFVYLIIAIPVLLSGEQLLLAIGQNPDIAKHSGQYLRIQVLGLVPTMCFEACKCYLQSQEIMRAGVLVVVCVLPIHASVNYILVQSSAYGIGISGAAIATVISEWLMFAGILIYARNSRATETWGGWDIKAIYNMYEYYRLAIPSVITVSAEFLCFELITFGASYFGTTAIGASAIVINNVTLAFEVSNGLGYSTSPRIGNLIGAGKPRQARIARDISLLVGAAIGLLWMLFMQRYGRWWITVYTNDPDLIREALKLIPILCTFTICDAINTVLGAVMRGIGRQSVSAATTLFSFYGIAVPLGMYLGYRRQMEVAGLWWGVCTAVIVSSIVQFVYAYLWIDWKDEVRRCLIRLLRSQGSQENFLDVEEIE